MKQPDTMTPEERKAHRTELLYFCPGCFATNEDSSGPEICDAHYCFNCGMSATVHIPRWATQSIREQASWVGKRYYPDEEDRITREELKVLRPLLPDHETDEWELMDWAKYTDHPDRPQPRLTLKRQYIGGRVISTDHALPHPYTDADVETAKAFLRAALPISRHYREAE